MANPSYRPIEWILDHFDHVGNVHFDHVPARIYQPAEHINSKLHGEGDGWFVNTPVFHPEED